MSRKRNPYIPLFTHDIMSSSKCRRLSMRATGLYLWLFCLMNEKPQQGRWALSTNEDHPTWKNSLTYRALQNSDKYTRLPMFATLMARKFLPWKSGEVLKALQELYRFKLIVVEDDAIIQPRMYRDNGFKLREETMLEYLADDSNGSYGDTGQDLSGTRRGTRKKEDGKGADKGEKKGTGNGTKKDPRKVHGIHAGARLNESESENIIINNKGNIGGTGDNVSVNPKTQEKKPDAENKASEGAADGGTVDLSSGGQKRATEPAKGKIGAKDAPSPKKKRQTVADNPPTLEEVQAYFTERAQQGRPFAYVTPEGFYDACCQSGWTLKDGKPMMDWRARVRTFENFRKDHGDRPVGRSQAPNAGDPVPVTGQSKGKYKNKW